MSDAERAYLFQNIDEQKYDEFHKDLNALIFKYYEYFTPFEIPYLLIAHSSIILEVHKDGQDGIVQLITHALQAGRNQANKKEGKDE